VRKSAVVCLVAGLGLGFAVGHVTAPARPQKLAAPPDLLPTEVSVICPDCAKPGEFTARRFRVTRSGSNEQPIGSQKNDEVGVTLWYGDPQDRPRRYSNHFGPALR
jgi:hypothetical protein